RFHVARRAAGAKALIGLVLLALLLVPPAGPARGEQGGGGGGEVDLLRDSLPPSTHARKLFDLVLKAAEYDGPPILLLASNSPLVQNACATYTGKRVMVPTPDGPKEMGTPTVLYNPTFMTQMSFAANNEDVCVFV